MKVCSFVLLDFLWVFIFHIVLVDGQKKQYPSVKGKDVKEEVLPPCQSCKVLANSFLKGMTKTNKKHFGGGDAAWEEEKLGDYAQSEVRLVEIQENLCSDVDRGQQQCYRLSEEWEQNLEDWWFKHQKTSPDLIDWLCIKQLEYCCPEYFYGPECKPCVGYPDKVCNNNGKCKGSGTRKGNGECNCNQGYSGANCEGCSDGFYQAYKDNEKLLCSKCHTSCQKSCSGPGPKGCKECKHGWIKNEERGCMDINECIIGIPCKRNEFCVNNDGSFTCLACDRACNGCQGDGPDMCETCAQGYTLKDGLCVGKKDWGTDILDWNRYLTYFGLCIATCIIFQRNTVLASIIGVSVAIYVSVSEYMLSSIQSQSQTAQEEINNLLGNNS